MSDVEKGQVESFRSECAISCSNDSNRESQVGDHRFLLVAISKGEIVAWYHFRVCVGLRESSRGRVGIFYHWAVLVSVNAGA
jgi:hypothetical protein